MAQSGPATSRFGTGAKPGSAFPCKVRLKLFTLDDALILRKTGALSDRDAEAVRDSLARFLVVDAGSTYVCEPGGTYMEPEPMRQ